LLGRAIDGDAREGDAFAKLARYERSPERSLFRALDELRQLQDRRRNRPSLPIFDAVTQAAGDTESRAFGSSISSVARVFGTTGRID